MKIVTNMNKLSDLNGIFRKCKVSFAMQMIRNSE